MGWNTTSLYRLKDYLSRLGTSTVGALFVVLSRLVAEDATLGIEASILGLAPKDSSKMKFHGFL